MLHPFRRILQARVVALVAACAALAAGMMAAPAAASNSSPSPDRPYLALDIDFPDPAILHADGRYYSYATNSNGRNLQVATAESLYGTWTLQPGDGLPDVGSWARTGLTWAPDVSRIVSWHNGARKVSYLAYYTARDVASNVQCVGAARSVSPGGPFTPIGDKPLVCPAAQGGAIDPAGFVAPDGTRYLVYKNDGNAIGVPTYLYLQRVSPDGEHLIGDPVPMIRNDPATEGVLVEAPYLIYSHGQFYLFYAYGSYANGSYTTAYATAATLRGPWTKRGALMTTATFGGAIVGPGGASFLIGDRGPDGRGRPTDHLVFHGVRTDPSFHRALYVDDLVWTGRTPHVVVNH